MTVSPAKLLSRDCSAIATTWVSEKLIANFTDDSKLALSTADIPTKMKLDPIVGENSIHTLDDLKRRRDNEVAFLLAKLTLEALFPRRRR